VDSQVLVKQKGKRNILRVKKKNGKKKTPQKKRKKSNGTREGRSRDESHGKTERGIGKEKITEQ